MFDLTDVDLVEDTVRQTLRKHPELHLRSGEFTDSTGGSCPLTLCGVAQGLPWERLHTVLGAFDGDSPNLYEVLDINGRQARSFWLGFDDYAFAPEEGAENLPFFEAGRALRTRLADLF